MSLKADELGAVFYIHPTFPVGVEAMQEFMLMPLVGFLADTTLAAGSLVYSGVVASNLLGSMPSQSNLKSESQKLASPILC